MTSFSCVTYDDQGVCYAGGANGSIYVWNGNTLTTTFKASNVGFVGAIRWRDGKLYSGGKDGFVRQWNTSTLTEEWCSRDYGALIRAIDVYNGKMLVGLRNGTIIYEDLEAQSSKNIMESHSEGEIWGLAVADADHVTTSADDNFIRTWNVRQRECVSKGTICEEDRKVKRGGASTLSTLADSKCSRALAFNASNGHLAVGHNDGTLTIRSSF
jgi:WD40 repeat protein